ncbi:MAG: hypothetical protein A3A58_02690 [Candidatus Blackburnbacteria bacterium RIFCSPLOWO2_01_FULL_41_27]|uniref:Uncharacterized protein n=2 Tax=Candidatus Blackburniibacteriota TaxID=1817898 RepID=A0A1G1VAU0_9BACT|nr:MAG: hypothetical protein A3F61_03760 [Candidatus Blackburnbacteria bacterium RIFCSPHIGHO2_12_FULL_41_13b]OGY14398.1 MAG: hypothetical protein A3A58_02690 [Candidatus Blackburnbacteria bacterium RIFCSPLOWO2_01_FULL_41_27]
MDAPFGIAFLKKAELYNLICRFDKQYRNAVKDGSFESSPWSIERQILRWTYRHHKHLGSPINTDHLTNDPKWSKLREFGMVDRKGKLRKDYKYLEKGHLTKPLENLVVRGFATYFDEAHAHNAIVISKEGLLVGEVIADIEKRNPFVTANYWFYSNIIDHLGASVLLVITFFGLLKFFGIFDIIKCLIQR